MTAVAFQDMPKYFKIFGTRSPIPPLNNLTSAVESYISMTISFLALCVLIPLESMLRLSLSLCFYVTREDNIIGFVGFVKP